MKKSIFPALCLFLSLSCFAQTTDKISQLQTLAQAYITAHNNTDTLLYNQWLDQANWEQALKLRKLQGFKNGARGVGALETVKIIPISDSSVQILAKDRQFDGWWKIMIYTNTNTQFKDRTLQPHRFSTELMQQGVLSTETIQTQIDNYLATKLQPFSGEILITKNNVPVYKKKIGQTNLYGLASLSKLFAAVAILQLRDEGKLALDDSLAKHLPFIKNAAIRSITIRQLLTHSSGLGDFFQHPEYEQLKASLKTDADFLPLLESDKVRFAPGSKWQYSNNGFAWLGILVSTLSHQNYEDYLVQHIFRPAGMNETSVQNGSGGGKSTVQDLNNFSQALRNSILLNKSSTKELLTYTFNEEYGLGSEHAQIGKEHIIGHSGGYIKVCTELNIYTSSGYNVIILSDVDPPFAHFLSNKIKELLIRN
jgi:hypothetical protein